MTILDVGAHKGQTTAHFNKLFPKSSLYAFEPSPELFPLLSQNLAKIKNSSCYNIALGSSDGEGFLTLPSSDLCGQVSLIKNQSQNSTKVSLHKLDTFSAEHNIEKIDLLKIDVEGQEISVLEGAKGLLQKNSIKSIFLECDFNQEDTQHSFFFDVFNYLNSKNFSFYGLFDLVHYSPSYGIGFCNALFLNRKVFSSL